MSNETALALRDFASAVAELTAACVLYIGVENASSILTRCEALKTAIRKETVGEIHP